MTASPGSGRELREDEIELSSARFAIYAAIFIATRASAIVITCPDGRICAVDDPAKCACVTMCDGTTWVITGDSCPSAEIESPPAREVESQEHGAVAAIELDPTRYVLPILALLFTAGLAFWLRPSNKWFAVAGFISSALWLGSQLPSQVIAAREIEANAASEKSRLDAEKRDAREKLCSDHDAISALAAIVDHIDGSDIFVRPAFWDSMPFKSREGFAVIAATCLGVSRADFRHGNTGRVLASWSAFGGFKSKE